MTWVGTATVGASIGGSLIKGNAASNAANQQSAADQQAALLQQQQYNQTLANNQPYIGAGQNAISQLQSDLGLGSGSSSAAGYGSLGKIPTAADVMATPGYQFGLDQGQNQLNRQLNASGMSNSGAQLKAAAQYGTNYATTQYNNAFNNNLNANNQVYNQLAGVSQIGQNANNSTANAGLSNATNQGNDISAGANSQAAATIANGGYLSDAINQGTSSYGSTMKKPSTVAPALNSNGSVVSNASTYIDPTSVNAQNGLDVGGVSPAIPGYADGGAVRVEPVVGSYSPLPGNAEAGGLSKDAIMNALFAMQQQKRLTNPASARTGIALLPANPVTQPQAVLNSQMQQAGAYAWGGPVQGPGGPQQDAIPAMLSNGEHVMDAASVNAIGGGNNSVGQNKLNILRKTLKARA